MFYKNRWKIACETQIVASVSTGQLRQKTTLQVSSQCGSYNISEEAFSPDLYQQTEHLYILMKMYLF